MSELSAAEKRKLLRERRAAKMAQKSSARLNKITGVNGKEDDAPPASPSPTPAPEPTSAPSSTVTSPAISSPTTAKSTPPSSASTATATSTSTPPNSSNLKQSSSSKNREGSRKFSDPPTSDLDTLNPKTAVAIQSQSQTSHSKVADPLHRSANEETLDSNADIDQLLNNLLSRGHDHTTNGDNTGPNAGLDDLGLPDDFMKLLGGGGFAQMMQQMQSQMPPGSDNDMFGSVGGFAATKSPEELQYEQSLAAYNIQQRKKFRLAFIVVRFLFVSILFFLFVYGNTNNYASFTPLRPRLTGVKRSFISRFKVWDNGDVILRESGSMFWNWFALFEIACAVLYLFLSTKFNILGGSGGSFLAFITGFLPGVIKFWVDLIMKYNDLYALFLNDLALVLVLLLVTGIADVV
ncbi:unnamed protein product [Ambrosiozyma monospora]|uniref:Unnamed protein product n=1 Tax=Ambrosiozyma monospora TaxID=43982 RepID=A0A9W6YSR3_AMBMO|nr:unnamed protein product [Ambrosiozyma monospora]